jgi:endonuclease YncB( thermonuclease family)
VEPAHVYRAVCERVIDGDTYVLRIDYGFHQSGAWHVRLYGVNAPELSTTAGKAARDYVVKILTPSQLLVVQTYKDRQSFERWVCTVWVDGKSLAAVLVDAGHAVPMAA